MMSLPKAKSLANVIILYDLKAQDGRSAVEARFAVDAGGGKIYASPKMTFYSCAYDTQAGRISAFNRVAALCDEHGCKILAYYCGQKHRAVWQ